MGLPAVPPRPLPSVCPCISPLTLSPSGRTSLQPPNRPSGPPPLHGGCPFYLPTPWVSGTPTSLPVISQRPSCCYPCPHCFGFFSVPLAFPPRHAAAFSAFLLLNLFLLLTDSISFSHPATVCPPPPQVLILNIIVSCALPLLSAPVDRPFCPLDQRQDLWSAPTFLRKQIPPRRTPFSSLSYPLLWLSTRCIFVSYRVSPLFVYSYSKNTFFSDPWGSFGWWRWWRWRRRLWHDGLSSQ